MVDGKATAGNCRPARAADHVRPVRVEIPAISADQRHDEGQHRHRHTEQRPAEPARRPHGDDQGQEHDHIAAFVSGAK